MQPSRQCCLWASLALLVCWLPAPRASADTLTITSTPPGATVEIDGSVVGTTPYRTTVPGGYFHKTHTVFSTRLDHAMTLRVSMNGYAVAQMNMTEGPFDWVAITGRHEGTYFLLRSNTFNVRLVAAQTARGAQTVPASDSPGSGGSSGRRDDQDASDTGSVLITSETEGAEIYADGDFVGQTPSTVRLAPGMHHIEVRAPGKPTWARDLNVMKSSRITLRAMFGEGESDGNVNSADAKGDDGATGHR